MQKAGVLSADTSRDIDDFYITRESGKGLMSYLQVAAWKEERSGSNRTYFVRDVETDEFRKNHLWGYEGEWRIVKEDIKDSLLSFRGCELMGIVFGHKMSKALKDCIMDSMRGEPQCFRTYIGYRTNRVRIIPENYEIVLDGREFPDIDLNNELKCDFEQAD